MIRLWKPSIRQKLRWIALLEQLGFCTLEWFQKTCFQLGLISRLKRSCQESGSSSSSFYCQLKVVEDASLSELEAWIPSLDNAKKKLIFRHFLSVNPRLALQLAERVGWNDSLISIARIALNSESFSLNQVCSLLDVEADSRYFLNRYNYFQNLQNRQESLSCLNAYLETSGILPVSLKETRSPFYICNIKPSGTASAVNLGPLVSVVVTAHNESKLIACALKSLIHQSYQNLQVIFVDDASTDGTWDIFIETCERLGFTNFKSICLSEKSGPFITRNLGIKAADGEFITFHDADDWVHPQRVENQLKAISTSGSVASISQLVRVKPDGYLFSKHFFPLNRMAMVSLMIERQVFRDLGYFYTDVLGADSEYVERIKLFYGEDQLKNVKQVLTFAAHRPGSQTTSELIGTPGFGLNPKREEATDIWRERQIDMVLGKREYYVRFDDSTGVI